MDGSTPWPRNLYSTFTALLLDGSVMQQCLLTVKHVLLTRKVPFVFSHPSSLRRTLIALNCVFLCGALSE